MIIVGSSSQYDFKEWFYNLPACNNWLIWTLGHVIVYYLSSRVIDPSIIIIMKIIIINILKFVILAIFLLSCLFFFHDLKKKYHGTRLFILNESLKRALSSHMTLQNRQALLEAALPIINREKNQFLYTNGYWIDIFNDYNQVAVVANLNGDKMTALKLLLVSIRYHPFLPETFRGLSEYLNQIGEVSGAKSCLRVYNQILNQPPIDLTERKICLGAAQKLTNDKAEKNRP